MEWRSSLSNFISLLAFAADLVSVTWCVFGLCSCGEGLPQRWHELTQFRERAKGPLATLAQCPRSKPPDGLQATCSRRLRCRLIRGQESHVQLFVCPLDK